MPVTYDDNGNATSFSGNAVNYYQVALCKNALDMYLTCGMLTTRSATPKTLRQIAARYTGVTYKASRAGLEQARTDLTAILSRDPDSVAPDGNQ